MNHQSSLHVVIGSGAVGSGTAIRLAAAGNTVKIVTRSGTGPDAPGIEPVAADASNAKALAEVARGAHAIYNCANPQYHQWATAWPPMAAAMLAAAESTGARLVTMSNLYGAAQASSPMKATDLLDPPSKKGAIRTRMWEAALQAHENGQARVTEARASDFFGPGIGASGHFGDRAVPRLLAGKSMMIIGRNDVEHSWSYIDDVCATLVALGTDDRALGRAWHVPTSPPMTAQALATAISRADGHGDAKVKTISTLMLKAGGVLSKQIRELVEMVYQFAEPFVIDAADTTEVFGIQPTPIDEQIAATIASYSDAEVRVPTSVSS